LLGGERAGVLLGDVWVFDLTARVWSQPLGTNINMPSPRSGHSVVSAPNATMLFVFGGMTSSGATNDIFVLSPFGYFDATIDEMTNVAVGKPASMSLMDTRWSQRGPGAANDGQINSRMNQQASQVLKTHWQPWRVAIFGDRLHVVLDDLDTDIPVLKEILAGANIQLQSLRPVPFSLEDAFISVVQRSLKT
jgi:hypothetical protein